MSQINLSDVGNPYSGALNSAFVNALKAALLSGNSMPQRPNLATAGMVWSLNISATERSVMFFDGLQDHMLIKVNPQTGDVLDVNPFFRDASNLNEGFLNAARVPQPSQAEAEFGMNNGKFMTPLRVKQAIFALGSAAVPAISQADFDARTSTVEGTISSKKLADTMASAGGGGWEPYGGAGTDPVVWDHAVDGNATIIETPTFDAGYVYRVFPFLYSNTATVSISVISFWASTSALWTNDLNQGGISNVRLRPGYIDLIDPANPNTSMKVGLAASSISTFANPPEIAATSAALQGLNIGMGSAQAMSKMRFTLSTADAHGAGNVKMYRSKING